MKKMAWITGILLCAMMVLSALGSVGNAVWQIAVDETFYSEQSRAAVKAAMGYETEEEVTAYIGLTPEEQKSFAGIMSAYMLDENQSVELPSCLSEDEARHMDDVRRLVRLARELGKGCMTMGAALAVAAAWTGSRLKKRGKTILAGLVSGEAVIALVVMNVVHALKSGGFAQMFTGMHEMLFTNDLWLMNPAEDILIRIMPQPLFEQAMLNGAVMALRMFLIVWILLLVVYEIVSRMIRRHVAKD